MRHLLPDGGIGAILVGNKNMRDHMDRINGFCRMFDDENHSIYGIYETQDEPEVAGMLIRKLLSESSEIGAIYVATGNSVSVCEYVDEQGLGGKIKIIATDIFPQIRHYLEKDVIQAVIFQDQISQGEYAIKSVFDYLSMGTAPEHTVFVQPQLILKSNIENTCSAYLVESKQ